MKTFALTIGALALCHTSPQAQPTDTARLRYEQINRETPGYRIVKRDLSGRSSEGGELIAYFQGKSPRKLVARIFGETGRATQEMFFWQGQLFFVLETETRYTGPITHPEQNGSMTRSQNRFYFRRGRLMKWIDASNTLVSPQATNYQQSANEVLDSARELLALARQKR